MAASAVRRRYKRDCLGAGAATSGSLWIDFKMGGGHPPGRIIGIAGPERSGKSLLVTEAQAYQLEAYRTATYYDAEGANDPLFLKARGIDFDKYRGKRNKKGELNPNQFDLINFYQPTTGEQVMHHMHTIMTALPQNRASTLPPPVLFVLDSVLALISDALTGDIDNKARAMHASMYSQILPVINGGLAHSGCTFIYTNQLRTKPGVKFGSPEYEPGGDALKFFSSLRLRLSSAKPQLWDSDHPFLNNKVIRGVVPKAGGVWQEPHLDENGKETGELDRYVYTAVRTEKNKVYNPFKVCWMRIQFEENGGTGRGLDRVFDTFSFLADINLFRPAVKTAEDAKAGIKVDDLKGTFELLPNTFYDLKKHGLKDRFTYYDFKHWVKSTPDLFHVLRRDLIESGLAYQNLAENRVDTAPVEEGEAPSMSAPPPEALQQAQA